MRLGDTKPITVEDLTFHVYRARGARRRWAERVREMLKQGDTPESQDAADDAYNDLTAEVVVSVDNLFDASGKPVEWPRGDKAAILALLDDLPAEVVDGLRTALLARTEPDAETGNASGGSEEPPSATSPATP